MSNYLAISKITGLTRDEGFQHDRYPLFNRDLLNLDYRQLLTHLEIYGLKEGRSFDAIVDLNLYLSVNSDVNRAYGGDRSLAFKHLVEYGLNEGRTFSQFFDLNYYKSNNPDLAAAGLSSAKQLLDHFELYGFYQGRAGRSDYAGNNLSTARNITLDYSARFLIHFVGTSDSDDYYRFTLNRTSTIYLNSITSNSDIYGELLDSSGGLLDSGTIPFNDVLELEYTLNPGTYFLHLQPLVGNNNYQFIAFQLFST